MRAVIRLAAACLLGLAAFAAYHFYLRGLMLDTGLTLGAVRPGRTVYRIVPLYIYWRPRLKTGLLIAGVVTAAFIWWLRCKRQSRRHSTAIFVAALMAWHVAIAVSVALIDGGPHKLWTPYDIHRRSDYIGAVAQVDSPRQFLRDYPRLMPDLPLHCRHHPPGGPLLLWIIARLFAPGPVAASLATILISSLATPAVYLLACDVLEESAARLAAGLFMLAPNVACYSATCMDAVFMAPLVWSFFFLWHGRQSRPLLSGAVGGLSASIAAMMTLSISFIALWSVVLLGMTALFERRRLRDMLLTLAAALAVAALFYCVLYAWSGYDPWAILRQAFAGQDEVMKGRGHSSMRQSFHFAITNMVAFLFCTGLPSVWLWLGQTARELHGRTASGARWLLLSFAVTLLLVDAAPLYTLETERIWIFLVGLAAIGAAARLTETEASLASSPLVTAALALQAGQTLLMESLFDWFW